jgi:glycosyltransferase involved in cell wall biosynthesis
MIVSVAMITYNHEKYISQAIESILSQNTDFQIQLVIGEDCSTDGTRSIVQAYRDRYPERIELLLPEHNQGPMGNLVSTLKSCRGKYIAALEGDDYWTDPLKLQKQVDFLEQHPEYVVCFHNTLIQYEDGRQSHLRYSEPWDTCNLEELIVTFNDFSQNNTAGHTSSMVYKNGLVKELPAWFLKSMSGDLPFQIMIAQYGKAKFINETMSLHRVLSSGVTRTHEDMGIKLFENRIMMYEGLKETLGYKFEKSLDQVLAQYYNRVGNYYFDHLRLKKTYFYYKRAFGRRIAIVKIVRYLHAHLFPSLSMYLSRWVRRIFQQARQ